MKRYAKLVWNGDMPAGIGDVNPIEYGGGYIYQSLQDGTYFVEHIEPPEDNDFDKKDAKWTVHRVDLDRMELNVDEVKATSTKNQWGHREGIILSGIRLTNVYGNEEWWAKDIDAIACESSDDGTSSLAIFILQMTSDDPYDRARGYWAIASHWGWESLDHYPEEYTRAEINKRYRHVDQAVAARRKRAEEKRKAKVFFLNEQHEIK